MGDRCYLEMTLRRADLTRLAPHVDAPPDEKWWDEEAEEKDSGLVTVTVHEANYAWTDERREAAEAGIPFFGSHGEGGEYGPYAFASLDGDLLEVPLSHDGDMILAVDERLEPLDDVGELRAYVAKLHAVRRLFGMPCEEAPPVPTDSVALTPGAHYVLHIIGDVEPDLHGPYPTESVRDDTARRMKQTCGDEDGLYRLDLDKNGQPVVAPYTCAELQVEEEAA